MGSVQVVSSGLSPEQLMQIGDLMPYRVYAKDRDGRFTYMNRATAELFGLGDPQAGLGRTDSDFFTRKCSEEFGTDERRVMESGQPITEKLGEEYRLPESGCQQARPNRLWVRRTTLPLRDRNGDIIGVFGVSRDVTEGQEDLDRYRLAVERTSDGLWHRNLKDDDDRVWTSPCWKRMLGLEEDHEVSYSEFCRLLHPDDLGKHRAALQAHLKRQTSTYECDFRLRHRNGEWVWVRARGQARFDGEGKPVDLAGSHTVMTESTRFGERLLGAINSLKDAFFFIRDQDSRFLFVNQAVADAYGTSKDDCIGKTDRELSRSPDQLEQAKGFRRDDLAVLGRPWPYPWREWEDEEQFVDASGRQRFLHTTKQRLDLPGHGPELLGVSFDITQLREARLTLRQLIDASDDAIYIKDTQGRFKLINRRMAEIVGLGDPALAVGKTHHDLFATFDPEHAALAEQDERDIIEGRRSIVVNERWATSAEGARFYSYTITVPIRIGDKVTGILAISRNMTKLKTQEELLRSVYNTLPQCVFIKDLEGRIIECNSSFVEWHKDARGIDSPIGMTDYDLWPNQPGQAEDYRRVDRQVMTTGTPSGPIQQSQVFPDGRHRTLLTDKFPRFDERGRVIGLLGIFRDITQQVWQQRDQFYVDISRTIGHCLSNWMGTLQANCNLLAGLHGVTGPVKRLQEAIRFLQHFSRIAGGLASIDRRPEIAQVTVREVLKRSIRLLADDRIHFLGCGEELIVEASEFHLQLVVAELLSNATRFARSSIEIWCTRSGTDYEIHVKDDGPGVVSRLKKGGAMFDAQTTTDEASHAGLGLSYVRRVANVHGGDVEEVGEPGEGAHFVVRLPIHPHEEEQA